MAFVDAPPALGLPRKRRAPEAEAAAPDPTAFGATPADGSRVDAPYHFDVPAPPPDPNAEPPKRDAIAAGFEAAKTNLMTGVPYNLRRQFGELPRSDQERYLQEFAESQRKQEALLPGGPIGLGQIKGIKDFGQFLAENLGYSLPQMVATAGGALAGAAAGTPEAPGVGTVVGALAGGAAATPFYIGSNTAAATDQGQKPLSLTGAQRSLGVAPLQALGDVAEELILPGVGKALNLPIRSAGKNIFVRGAKQGLKAGAIEFGTEGGQQVGEQYAQERDLLSPEARRESIMAAATGGVLGGTLGVAGSPFAEKHAPEDKTQNLPEDKVPAKPVSTSKPTQLLLPAPTPAAPPEADTINVPGQRLLPAPPEGSTRGQAPAREGQLSDQRLPPQQSWRNAIGRIESGNSYTKRGPVVKTGQYAGEQAAGRYGIMPGNIAEWSRAALGHEVSLQEFLASPQIQDAIFDHRFGGYVRQFGNADDAASAWLTGRRQSQAGGRADPLGTDASKYVSMFHKYGGAGGAEYAGASHGGGGFDVEVTPDTPADELLARIEALSGEKVKKATPAETVARAIAKDTDKADALIQKATDKWQEKATALEQDKTLSDDQRKTKGDVLDREQRVLIAARDTAREMREARNPTAQSAAVPPVAPAAAPAPVDMAQAGEQLAADGALDRLTVAAQPQAAPLDEASTAAIAKTRAGVLDRIIKNPIIGDPRAAFMSILANSPEGGPLSVAEDHALKVATQERLLTPPQETAAPKAAEPKAAEPIAPEPVKAAEPTADQQFADETKAHAETHMAALGSKPVVKHWFNEGVKAALGEEHLTPDESKDRGRYNNLPNFERGKAFVAARRGDGAPEAKAEPTPEPKKQPKTEATQKATTAKADKDKADKAAAETARAAVRAKREAKAAEDKAAKDKAAKVKAAKRTAEKKTAAEKKAKKPGKPKPEQTKATKQAITAKQPKPAPAHAPEPTAEEKLKADIEAFETKTQKAADDDHLSGFQRQNLDILADKTGNLELAEAALEAEKVRFDRGGKDPSIGKGETLADLLARAKETSEAAPARNESQDREAFRQMAQGFAKVAERDARIRKEGFAAPHVKAASNAKTLSDAELATATAAAKTANEEARESQAAKPDVRAQLRKAYNALLDENRDRSKARIAELDAKLAAREKKPRGRLAMGPATGVNARGLNEMAALDKRLRAALDRRGLADVLLETTTKADLEAQTGKPGASGRFGIDRATLQRAVQVAMDSENPLQTLDHELVHALEDMGVIKPKDWTKLVAAARADPDMMAYLDEHYSDLSEYERDGEAVAEMFSRWSQDPANVEASKVPGASGILARVKALFAALKSWITQSDYKTAEDVMRAIERGEVGAKTRTAAPGSSVVGGGRLRVGAVRKAPEAHARRTAIEKGKTGLNLLARTTTNKGLLYLTPTEDMANIMVTKGIPAGRRVVDEHSQNHALGRKYEESVLRTKEKIGRLPAKYQGVGPGSISRLVHDSTMSDKWAFSPTEKLGFPAGWDTKAVVDPKLADQFKTMPAEAQEAVQEMFKYFVETNDILRADVEAQIAESFKAEMAEAKTDKERSDIAKRQERAVKANSRAFDTQEALPYAPLKRSGWWVVSAKSPEFRAAEDANDQEAIDKLISDDSHNFVRFTDTLRQAEALASNVADKFGAENVDYFERSKVPDGAIHKDAVFLGLDQLKTAVASSTTKGSQMATRMDRLVNDLYLHMLTETSARKGELGRAKVPSIDPLTGDAIDMVQAFVSRGTATANLIAAVHNGGALTKAIHDMHGEVGKLRGEARTEGQRMVNEMMYRYTANNNVKPSRNIDKMVRGISAYTLLSSPFYYIQNFTQAALISLPILASKYGYVKAWGHFMAGYKEFAAISKGTKLTERIDFAKASPEYADLMEFLANRGRLDAGFAAENGHWEVTGDGVVPATLRSVDRFFRMMPQRIEVANRVATGVAAYNAAIEAGKSKEAAMEEASKLIYDTHGDYSGFNAPTPWHQLGNAAKVMLQFRKFQVIMGSLIGKEFHRAFLKGEATREERVQGFKALAFLSAHMAAIGGVLALPGANLLGPVIGTILNLLDPDDDKDWSEWQEDMREALGAGGEGAKQNPWADFLYKGAPYALLGMDTSDRLGMGNIYALAPYADIDTSTSKEKMLSELAKAMLGPSGNLLSKAYDGWGFGMEQHDWMRMAETLAPSGPSNALKAYRLATDGLTAPNGDVKLKPELNQGLNELYTAIGVRPRNLVNQGERATVVYKKQEFYAHETTRLKREFSRAAKDGDRAGMQDVRQEWMAKQAARKRDGIKPQPLSELLQAPREQLKRERGMIGGVATTAANRQAAMAAMFADTPEEAREMMGLD